MTPSKHDAQDFSPAAPPKPSQLSVLPHLWPNRPPRTNVGFPRYALSSPDTTRTTPSGRFAALITQNINPSSRVLEIGAGSGRNHQSHFDLRGKVASYVGADLDPIVLRNPFLDESVQAGAESLPFDDSSFNVVFHNFVAEHFQSPADCNREIARVLKPGGVLLFQTPCRYYYPSIVASLTPALVPRILCRAFRFRPQRGRGSSPTFYRLNDSKTITTQLQSCGFTRPDIEHHSLPPGYLRFNKFAFLAGVLFERTFERHFPSLRGQIIVVARKQSI